MPKNKISFWHEFCVLRLVLVLVLGLCAVLWASDKHMPFRQKPNGMENPSLLEKGSNTPLTLDSWLSQRAQKASQSLAGTGAIRGRITQSPGGTTPIENIYVVAYKLTCPYYSSSAYSDPDGYYIIESLPAGKYEVYTDNDFVFVDVYWDNKPMWGEPDTVTVVSNDTTEDINFLLREGGRITGRVTMSGAIFTSVTVSAEDTLSHSVYYGLANILIDSASYEIKKLPTGIYKVNTANSDSFVDQYYNNKPDEASADPVAVTEGSTHSNIDFTLALGGKIAGTVTLPGASSVTALIYATNITSGKDYSGFAYSPGNSATYGIVGLPTGNYKVYTSNFQGYLDEYYNDKPDESSADLVSVTAGSTHPNIDFILTLGGIIKGTISSAKGPLQGIPIYAYSTSSPLLSEGSGTTDGSGNYRINGLGSGYYKIYASGDTTYAYRYYNNDSTWSTADSVLVTAADSVTGKNFSLEVGGVISGYVYGDGGVPLSGEDVTAIGLFDQVTVYRTDTTSADGSYKIGGLRTGNYLVLASIECDQMWYNNKPFGSPPDSVPVTMPDTTPNINFNFPSAVEDEDEITQHPSEFELHQNYPNPFNPETRIEYALKKTGHVALRIYNILGEKVKTLLDQDQPAGLYRIDWDGKNDNGKFVSSGLYLYKLEVNGFSQAKRMLLLK
jgi:hypothetical protein